MLDLLGCSFLVTTGGHEMLTLYALRHFISAPILRLRMST